MRERKSINHTTSLVIIFFLLLVVISTSCFYNYTIARIKNNTYYRINVKRIV